MARTTTKSGYVWDAQVATVLTTTDGVEVLSVAAQAMEEIGSDRYVSGLERSVAARRTARTVILRHVLRTAGTGDETLAAAKTAVSKGGLGASKSECSQIRRGIDREATYAGLGIAPADDDAKPKTDTDPWTVSMLERRPAREWEAHLNALAPADDDATGDGSGSGSDGSGDDDTTDRPVSAKVALRRLDAALSALQTVEFGDDDADDARRIAGLVAEMSAVVADWE